MNKTIPGIGVLLLLAMLLIALLAPVIAPYNPHNITGTPYMAPCSAHLLGTNDIGQDILSEIIYGTRTSLFVGVLSAAISMLLGTFFGILAGWYGGAFDRVTEKLIAFFMTIPYIPSIIILSAMTKSGPCTTAVVLGVMSWSGTARVVRSQTIAIKSRDYIQTLRAMGAPNRYVLVRHVMRELLPWLMYRMAARVKAGILSESTLSFLGLGSTTQKSWGTIIYYAQSKNSLLTGAWRWWILPPGLCIILVSCALVMISYGAESTTDRRLERR
jgi:ABC-type dipeptide/oligopeptide/nickel transport systems, permease components